jgi:hypothetical protein
MEGEHALFLVVVRPMLSSNDVRVINGQATLRAYLTVVSAVAAAVCLGAGPASAWNPAA